MSNTSRTITLDIFFFKTFSLLPLFTGFEGISDPATCPLLLKSKHLNLASRSSVLCLPTYLQSGGQCQGWDKACPFSLLLSHALLSPSPSSCHTLGPRNRSSRRSHSILWVRPQAGCFAKRLTEGSVSAGRPASHSPQQREVGKGSKLVKSPKCFPSRILIEIHNGPLRWKLFSSFHK